MIKANELTPHYEITIGKYSDYNAHDPYWINLCQEVDDNELRKKMSDTLNDYFRKNGPDANADYTSFSGPLMQYTTAEKALMYAIRKCRAKVDMSALIDGCGSIETDARNNDPVTGELLHTIPVNKDSILDEIECLIEQDELSKDDWVWLDFVVHGYGTYDSDVNAKLRQLTRKHR